MPSDPAAPFVSVVVPVFNGSDLVGRALDSLRRQILAAWEVLCVDDGSADGTLAVLDRWAASDPRVRLFRHPINRGLSVARNTALAVARGEWVAYLDHDDEFDPDHLARIHRFRDAGDVLLFPYRLVEERAGHPHFGRTSTYDPAARFHTLGTETIAVPLGVAHRRAVLARSGYFDETRGRHRGRDEDGDLWRRFAAAGAKFAHVPEPSGTYHVRGDSLARTRPDPPAALPAPADVFVGDPWRGTDPARPRVLFASHHAYRDPASGAALCTRDLFAALAARRWACAAVTGSRLDDPRAVPLRLTLRDRPGVRVEGGVLSWVEEAGYPVTVIDPDPPVAARLPTPADVATFADAVARAVKAFRPDVLLTYGGDPASRAARQVAKAAGAKVVFWLHNFAYAHRGEFADCDAVVVPSRFSRDHYREKLGMECVPLPPPIDPARVLADRPDGGRFVTLVNPEPGKGGVWLAGLAAALGRTRPDIPFLAVEGRGRADGLAGIGSVRAMANTPDPRRFFRLTRLLLVPSVAAEPFGRVAAEGLMNGIPVIASDRGGIPETVGDGGLVLPLPAAFTAATRTPPTAEEVAPWADAVVRLWDDPEEYRAASARAKRRAARWHPDAVADEWERFLGDVARR